MQITGYSAGQAMSNLHTIVHVDPLKGNKRDHIDSPDAGMNSFVYPQINQLDCLFPSSEGCLNNCILVSNEGEHGPMMGRIGRVTKQKSLRSVFDLPGDGFQLCLIPTFADVHGALNDFLHRLAFQQLARRHFTTLCSAIHQTADR